MPSMYMPLLPHVHMSCQARHDCGLQISQWDMINDHISSLVEYIAASSAVKVDGRDKISRTVAACFLHVQ